MSLKSGSGGGGSTGTLNFVGSTDSTTNRGIRHAGASGAGLTTRINANGTSGAKLVFSGDNDGFFNEQWDAITATRTLVLGGASTADNEIAGIIRNSSSAAAGHQAITKDGDGKWILSGNNTYTGVTTVNAGTLVISGDNSARSGATTINAGTLVAANNNAFGAGTTTLIGGANTGTLALQGGITLAGPAVQFQGRNDDYQASTGGIRNLSGNNTITVVGAGGGENYAFTSEQDTLTVNYSTPVGAANRTYIFDGAGDITFNGNMGAHTVPSHGVSIYKVGTGTTTLTGNNPITGEVQVNAGGLIVNNIAGSGTGTGLVTVASGARIGGSGAIGGDLTLLAGARFVFDPLTTLNVTGDVTLDDTFGVASLVNADGSAIDWSSIADGIYTIVGTTASTFNNISNFGDTAAFDIGGGRSAYFQNGSLELVVVPEPATYALIGGLLALGAVLTRRRMK